MNTDDATTITRKDRRAAARAAKDAAKAAREAAETAAREAKAAAKAAAKADAKAPKMRSFSTAIGRAVPSVIIPGDSTDRYVNMTFHRNGWVDIAVNGQFRNEHIHLDQIASVTVGADKTESMESGSGIGRAAVGGVLFGGSGAIAGAASANGRKVGRFPVTITHVDGRTFTVNTKAVQVGRVEPIIEAAMWQIENVPPYTA